MAQVRHIGNSYLILQLACEKVYTSFKRKKKCMGDSKIYNIKTHKQRDDGATNKGNFRAQGVDWHRREHLWKEKGRHGGSKSDEEG